MEYDIKVDSYGTRCYKKGTKILHREDGPAIEDMNGYKEWWINGIRLSPEKEEILNKWWNNKNGI